MNARTPTLDFEARVRRQADLYFEQILPRFIDAYLCGRGYRFIAEMMRCHDSGDVTAILSRPDPTRRARGKALGARAQCPVVVRRIDQVPVPLDPRSGGLLLGRFTKRTSTIEGEVFGSSRMVGAEWAVEVFEGGITACYPEAEWDDQILFTIFHELIHYFESFLPDRDQPLRGREHGDAHIPAWSPEEGRRRDRVHVATRAAGLAAVVLLVVGVALMGFTTIDTSERVAALEAHDAQLTAVRDELLDVKSRRAAIEREARRLEERLRLLRADPSYDPEAVARTLASVSDACLPLDGDRTCAYVRSGTPPSAVLALVARALPNLTLERLDRGAAVPGWALTFALPGGAAAPAPVGLPTPPEAVAPPTFQSGRGRELRARIERLRPEVAALIAEVGHLVGVEARSSALEASATPLWRAARALDLVTALSGLPRTHATLTAIDFMPAEAIATWTVDPGGRAPVVSEQVLGAAFAVTRTHLAEASSRFTATLVPIPTAEDRD